MNSGLVDIDLYMKELLARLQEAFAGKMVYLGLQGSYSRREATPESDIDIFLVLDQLNVADLATYKNIISTMDNAAKSCGFICGRLELANWNPFEVCQLVHETKDYWGQLRPLLPSYNASDIASYLKIQAGNLYHQLCHGYIHNKNGYTFAELNQAYKAVFYFLQNKYYLQRGEFILAKKDLLPLLQGNDQAVLSMDLQLKDGADIDFTEAYNLLFAWCQQQLQSI
ncbi:MAG: nucleotidyltransferase domain-containing protein [Firmicutes bacterium]|nr:nucleotidyltransferase domain-containing protein [Bacillota bacterium]